MYNINTDRGLSYTIPVDSIDLNYLSKYVNSSAVIPLWTKTRLDGEGGYCQVQILTQNDEECYSEPTDTFKCHICNIHVPVTCSKEHNESEQHKTFKNIYQKVLEKLSKQIDMSAVKHDEKIDKETYYCLACSKIIKKENKDKHESSEFHAKSTKDTIIISEFYKIIKEDRSHTDDIILIEDTLDQDSDLEPVNTKSFIENNNYAKTINKNNNRLDNGHDNSTDLPTNVSKLGVAGPSKNDNKIQPPNEEKAETFEEYLKAMIKKYKLNVNLPMIKSEEIWIESLNGDIVSVSHKHFQSYKQVTNTSSIYCQLCKMWISQDTKSHDVTESHVRNIFKPINEKFARMIDSVSSHCVPCNCVVLTDCGLHALGDDHKAIVKKSRIQKVGQTYCEDCNRYIDTHNFAAHIISKKHLNSIMIQNSIDETENPNIFFCKLCNLTVSKNGIKNHVVANMHLIHKSNGATKLNNNCASATDLGNKNTDSSKISDKNTNSTKTNDKNTDSPVTGVKINNSEYCKICKVKVPIGGMEIHIDGKAHKQQIIQLNKNDIKSKENRTQNSNGSSTTKQKMNEYLKLLCYTDDAKTMVNCEICYVNINNVDRNIIEHMEGRNHEKAETGLLQFHLITKESSGYFCECCEIHTTEYLEHINSRYHTNKFLQEYEIDKNEMRKYVYEDDVNDCVAYRHRERYRNLLRHNDIVKLNDTSFYCGMCQIKMGRISELDHVLGERHELKLAEIESIQFAIR